MARLLAQAPNLICWAPACLTRLVLTQTSVETHIAGIFAKLDLYPEPDDHRRVLAVFASMEP